MSEDNCDDLLDGEDEEDLVQDNCQGNDMDILADLDGPTPAEREHRRQLDFELISNLNIGDFELDEDDEDKVDDGLDVDMENKSQTKQTSPPPPQAKTLPLEVTPPGLNIFMKTDDGQHIFRYFDYDSLNLETDFMYSRRRNLKGHGMTNQSIDEILSDKFTFLRHLMPEAQSILLCDKQDFRCIMDFLFYSISVCTDHGKSNFLIKSFFDLAKNYDFSWRLSMKHVLTVLLNYDIQPHAVSSSQFNKHLKGHRKRVIESGMKIPEKLKLDSAKFLKERKLTNVKKTCVPQDKFTFCVSRFLQVVCELYIGMPTTRLDFRNKADSSELFVFAFLINIIGTDKMFVEDFSVLENIRMLYVYLLESIPSELWYMGQKGKIDKSDKNNFTSFSFPNTFSRLLHDFPAEGMLEPFRTWMTETKKDHEHHLNIIHKLNLFPQSYRGNQMKKFLAYLYLQTQMDIWEINSPNYPSVCDIANNHPIMETTFIKLSIKLEDYPTLLTIVKLCDIIVGSEQGESFSQSKIESIRLVKEHVLEIIEKKLPSPQSSRETEKLHQLMQLKSHVQIVKERWDNGCARSSQ